MWFGLTEVSDSARVVELLAAEYPIEVKSINEAMAELSERLLNFGFECD